MTENQLKDVIVKLEQIEQTLYNLLENTHDPEVREELKNLRHHILQLNQERILEQRKAERRRIHDRRSSEVQDRRTKNSRRSRTRR